MNTQRSYTDPRPLTEDESALLNHVMLWGSDGYPVEKTGNGRKWRVGPFRSWPGCPALFRTKREAVAWFESWHALARERLAANGR